MHASIFSKIFPGLMVTFIIAVISTFLTQWIPNEVVGASVIALFTGILCHSVYKSHSSSLQPGVQFASKRLLRTAIIFLGASLNMMTILNVGQLSLMVMCFTLLTCFGGGYVIGKHLGLNWKLSSLLNAGTGICGGSAIAAIAPVIDAEDSDIAYAISATFIFDILMIVLFPIMGHALNLSDIAYGLWTGTAVNDTSSVVAAGYAYSEAAGDFATMVKLTRTLVIIPTVMVFAWIHYRQQKTLHQATHRKHISITHIFPWFILGFLTLALLNSYHLIPQDIGLVVKKLSKFLMVMALAGIGLKTDLKSMKQSGWTPMLHGFIISALVVIVSLAVEYMMRIV